MLKIVISDDHRLVRDAWSLILNREKRFRVVGTSGDSSKTVSICKRLQPDILLIDINMKPLNGIEATKQVLGVSPETGIIAVTSHNEPGYAIRMMEEGARGYVTKNSSSEEMFKAILKVGDGKNYVCAEMRKLLRNTKKSKSRFDVIQSLSQRELEIIGMIGKGRSSKKISEQLKISIKTVEVHRHNILKKLGLSSSAAVIQFVNDGAAYL